MLRYNRPPPPSGPAKRPPIVWGQLHHDAGVPSCVIIRPAPKSPLEGAYGPTGPTTTLPIDPRGRSGIATPHIMHLEARRSAACDHEAADGPRTGSLRQHNTDTNAVGTA
jgi:hypothetical protein